MLMKRKRRQSVRLKKGMKRKATDSREHCVKQQAKEETAMAQMMTSPKSSKNVKRKEGKKKKRCVRHME